MTDTIQHLTYDDFGRVIRNDRGGRKADMSYAYDQLHGWTTGVKSGGGFEQKLYRETGALLLKNGKAGMYQFQGGYYSFNSNGVLDGCHYYIQDYQGPRSIKEGLIILRELRACLARSAGEQVEPLGESPDRTFGLDLYDYHARQQDPKLGCFTSIDPLVEKYYRISPYAYCAGDPVNCIDPDGRKIVVLGSIFFKDNYNYAVTYLKSIGAGAIIERLEKDPNFTITVTMATGKTPSEYKNGKLRWNPSQGVLTDNNYILSPAEVLNHEADHGLDDKTNPHHTENSQTDTNNQYDSKEEERVITGSEQDTAEKTGKKVPIGGTRTNHNGTPVEVENCISSKPNL